MGRSSCPTQNGVTTSFFCAADFVAAIRMSFLDPDVVSFNLGAVVSYDSTAPPPSVSFGLKAYVTSTLMVRGFPFIKINYIGGEIALTPTAVAPFVSLRSMSFAANATVLDARVAVQMLYDQPKADFGIAFRLQSLDLQVG